MCRFPSQSCTPVNPCKHFNFRRARWPQAPFPLANSSVVLNSTGVAGFLGGEATTSIVVSMLTCVRRGWLGWYDSQFICHGETLSTPGMLGKSGR
ncbi:hypothetical protein EDD17DRAFT_863023 [Pisolithus thermaeus]|nr:hypothetical protein EV401DRAFT_1365023 [Pisolithus croceorrhizus]KAI6167795.1 hypothetical protein EDD17DRAFT_863023 [Pisolithus thermaeus]